MGNSVGGAGGPSSTGYVPTGTEVVGNPPPGAGGAARGSDVAVVPRGAVIADGVDTARRPGAADAGAGTAGTGEALAAPSTPRRLQDLAARAGDTSATGGDAGGIQSFGDFLLAILEFFAEIFTFGQYDSRLFNDYTSGDRQRITEGGRAAARGIYEGGNGAQLDQFIVRSGTPPTPEMQGNPPLVRVRPELRAAVEAEVRQAFTTGDPPQLGISEQALRLRVDSMMRGIREEMTARQSSAAPPEPRAHDGRASSDAEGMSALAQQAMPGTGFSPVTTLYAGRQGGPNVDVAILRAPDGALYVQASGRDAVRVRDTSGDGLVSGDELRAAVYAELRAIDPLLVSGDASMTDYDWSRLANPSTR